MSEDFLASSGCSHAILKVNDVGYDVSIVAKVVM